MKGSTWKKDIPIPPFDKELSGDARADVVIIGAGMAGTVAAYMLARAGKSVIVIDKSDALENSATVHTTAFLSSDIDTDLPDLIDMFGRQKAADVWRSHAEAIDWIEKIIQEEDIECEFMRCPEFWYATSATGWDALTDEAHEGLREGFRIEMADRSMFPFKNFGAYAFHNQGKFHPLKFLIELRKRAENRGAKFYGHTEALDVKDEGRTQIVQTNRGIVIGEYVMMATYRPLLNTPRIFAKKGMYRSYVHELDIPKGSLVEGTYIDDNNPYNYFRVDAGKGARGGDRMIIGGQDHRDQLPVERERQWDELKKYLHHYFSDMRYEIVTSWTGPIFETYDGLAYIGHADEKRRKLLVATGFSGNGMTYSVISGNILTDIVLGRKNKYEDLYSPYRPTSLKALWYKGRDYVGEFIEGYIKNLFK